MVKRSGYRRMPALLLLLSVAMVSGCVKGTSDIFIEEMELCAARELAISNPVGNVTVTGNAFNDSDGVVFIKTEKYVDAYSLFGFASPNAYLDSVMVSPTLKDGRVELAVQLGARGFLERLFVRIVPHVNRFVETPTYISTNAEVQFGNMHLRNLPGNVTAAVSVGNVTTAAPMGIFGEQHFDIHVGKLELSLSPKASFEYDLAVDIGKAEFQDFDLNLHQRIMGARAAGLKGTLDQPGLITAKVSMGTLTVKAQETTTLE